MSLDSLYGVAQVAAGRGSRAWEATIPPQSLTCLRSIRQVDDERADVLAAMFAAQSGCLISSYFFMASTIIWIIDEDGFLNIAVEEAAHPHADRPTIPILLDNRSGSNDWRKLGHVSLLKPPHLGRIAGEIILRRDQSLWELNNSSGRFGLNCGRTREQLVAVAKVFTSYGLRVDIDFL
jgi:hypothetical protein